MNPELAVGIDVAKDELVAAVWRQGRAQPLATVANNASGLARLAAQVTRVQQRAHVPAVHVAVEPTAGYEQALLYFARQQGWRVSLVHASQFRDYVKSLGVRAKTDALDAALLTRYVSERDLPLWQPLPAGLSPLAELYDRQRELETMLLQERNRRAMAALRPDVPAALTASFDATLAALEHALRAVQQALQDHLDQQPEVRQRLDDVDSVPGIGARTKLPILLCLARWDARTQGAGADKALVAFVGLDPLTHQSGRSRKRGGISKMGDPDLRRVLFMAALGGKRGRNPLRDFYQRLVGRGKLKMVALVAAARKILIWAWAVYRTRQPFDPTRLALQTP